MAGSVGCNGNNRNSDQFIAAAATLSSISAAMCNLQLSQPFLSLTLSHSASLSPTEKNQEAKHFIFHFKTYRIGLYFFALMQKSEKMRAYFEFRGKKFLKAANVFLLTGVVGWRRRQRRRGSSAINKQLKKRTRSRNKIPRTQSCSVWTAQNIKIHRHCRSGDFLVFVRHFFSFWYNSR